MAVWPMLQRRFPAGSALVAPVATFGCLGLTGPVAAAGAVGAGFIIGHNALAVMMPVVLATLGWGYSRHRQLAPLAAGTLALGMAYLHVFAKTPDWTLTLVIALNVVAAVADWRAARTTACSRRFVAELPQVNPGL